MFNFKKMLSFLIFCLFLTMYLFALSNSTIYDVFITDDGFVPNPAKIELVDTICWFNNGSIPHTTTSLTGLWDSDTLSPGQSFSLTFNDKGSFPYRCKLSPGLVGTIIVKTSDVETETGNAANSSRFSLSQNYPNPFNPVCNIEYFLPKGSEVKLVIYNIFGQKVRVLVDEYQTAGSKSVRWDGKDCQGREVTSGIYFYKIEAGDFVKSKRMVMIK